MREEQDNQDGCHNEKHKPGLDPQGGVRKASGKTFWHTHNRNRWLS